MRAKLIQIGNSRGIRLPKAVIEQTALGEEVELEVQGDTVLIRNTKRARQGWEVAFAKMAKHGDDRMLDSETSTKWDETEWEW